MGTASEYRASDAGSVAKALILSLYTIAVTLGFAPFVLFLQWPPLVGIVAIPVAAGAFIAGLKGGQVSGSIPGTSELTLALLGASGLGALCAFMGFGFYAAFHYGAEGVAWVSGLKSESFVFYASVALALILIVAISTDQLPAFLARLYAGPEQATVYRTLLRESSRRLLGLWVGTVCGILAFALIAALDILAPIWGWAAWLASSSTGLLFGLSIYWMMLTQSLWDPAEADTAQVANLRLAEKVKTLLEVAGYQVRIHPKTGDEEADALVSLLDFLALRPDRALAGRIKFMSDETTLKREMANLQPAVWALADKLSSESEGIELEPVAFLVGDSLRAEAAAGFSGKSSRSAAPQVQIVNIASEAELDGILGETSLERRKDRATRLIDPSTAAMSTEAGAPP